MITIIDYGSGNVLALANVYRRLGLGFSVARSRAELEGCTKLILPGVGAFDHAMSRFEASGMRESVVELVKTEQVPILGICVGMQMLATASDEGSLPGLGLVDGRVKALGAVESSSRLPIPHMGWNDVQPTSSHPLFQGLQEHARFYFLHSYYFECARAEDVMATVEYGRRFTCAVNSGSAYGVQFHPEKSHHWGVQLLQNFAEL
ncbi:imidazole glycerol phosphate synthase subunit HisH [Alkalilimnicola sp. S0819]|uniref:imidazole glycerol phosphate synthase subunit HisH n=1 Tax=Alkalilimnicola sp. S0819 TaxID=2613922 RepID=UPI00126220B4|nr:imidazole glycerol phosphate synthase subunit HisH [Alkalilimnicola sp. S0819]KAB7628246.1 imidazole glycerol phosphate synthase subunit HisH [Alkalilimnicola sp. S0819]MPQ15137.1 imidazole glycerol phosphate synthase subunit HisH [Alkalilimnicola sp. S0819]